MSSKSTQRTVVVVAGVATLLLGLVFPAISTGAETGRSARLAAEELKLDPAPPCVVNEVSFSTGEIIPIHCGDYAIVTDIFIENGIVPVRYSDFVSNFESLGYVDGNEVSLDVNGRVTELHITDTRLYSLREGSWTTLTQMTTNLRFMSELKVLDLSGNELGELNLGLLPNGLVELNLSDNSVSLLYSGYLEGTPEFPPTLRVLKLDSNLLTSFEAAYLDGVNLNELYLKHNHITNFFGDICSGIETCEFEVCPQDIGNPSCQGERYVYSGEPPVDCELGASPSTGEAPLTVVFSYQLSDTEVAPSSLDFGGDEGVIENPSESEEHTYLTPGDYLATLGVLNEYDEDVVCATQMIRVLPPLNYVPEIVNFSTSADEIVFETYDPDLEETMRNAVDVYLGDVNRGNRARRNLSGESTTYRISSDEFRPARGARELTIYIKDFYPDGSYQWRAYEDFVWDQSGNTVPRAISVERNAELVRVTVSDPDLGYAAAAKQRSGPSYEVELTIDGSDTLTDYVGESSSFVVTSSTASSWPEDAGLHTLQVWMKDYQPDGRVAATDYDGWVLLGDYLWDLALECKLDATPANGYAPLEVAFTATSNGESVTGLAFGDGTVRKDATTVSSVSLGSHTYTEHGSYRAVLTIDDSSTCAAEVTVTAMNAEPEVVDHAFSCSSLWLRVDDPDAWSENQYEFAVYLDTIAESKKLRSVTRQSSVTITNDGPPFPDDNERHEIKVRIKDVDSKGRFVDEMTRTLPWDRSSCEPASP